MKTAEFSSRMEAVLHTEHVRPFLKNDVLFNGLQTRGSGEVTRVGFGVSASMELFRLAKEQRCDAVVVHHGLSVTEKQLDALHYERFAYLIQNNIALWGAHYSLDAHPELGNNVQILKAAGATVKEPWTEEDGMAWGWVGEMSEGTTLDGILATLKPMLSPATIVYAFGRPEVRRVVCVSGKGAPWAEDTVRLRDAGVDLYITGEVHEWNREFFREAGLNLIGGGHYHTEMFGVRALQSVVGKDWGLETVWLDLPNDV